MKRLATGLLLLSLAAGCAPAGLNYDPQEDVHLGQEAQDRILSPGTPDRADPSRLPESATNFYLFDGGTFNGTIKYWSFRCDSVEDCWAALTEIGAPPQSDFREWKPSRYAMVMEGPSFYWPELATEHWDVRLIRKGAMWEHAVADRSLDFYAIDFDRKRVYYHRESGGFPADASSPEE